MEQQHSISNLLLKPNKKKGLPTLLLLFLILKALTAFSIFAILKAPPDQPKLYFTSWLMCILFPYALIYMGIQLLPGQGNLALTPDGFRVTSWLKSLRRNYQWSDVTGFYVSNVGNGKITQERVCFDLATLVSHKRRQFLTFQYDQTPQELADLLNQWKERYAPNPEGTQLTPLLEAPVTQKSVWKAAGIQILIVFGFMVAILTWFFLFSKTDIRVVNNTKEPVESLSLLAFTFVPESTQAFGISRLLPGQEATVSIPHFDKGLIRIDYQSDKPGCAYLQHEQCVWHSGETIFLEPNGKFATNISYCKPQKTDRIDRIIVGSCADNDLSFKGRKFKYSSVAVVEPNKLTSVNQQLPGNKDAYVSTLQAEIKKHWHPPIIGEALRTTVKFTIQKDGTLTNIAISKPSGNQELDESTIQAIISTSPLPPLPPDIKAPSVASQFTFDYQVKRN